VQAGDSVPVLVDPVLERQDVKDQTADRHDIFGAGRCCFKALFSFIPEAANRGFVQFNVECGYGGGGRCGVRSFEMGNCFYYNGFQITWQLLLAASDAKERNWASPLDSHFEPTPALDHAYMARQLGRYLVGMLALVYIRYIRA
jgi:hypothetical protein